MVQLNLEADPSNPAPAIKSAPLWRRFAALGYDILVLGGVSMAYGAAVTALLAFFKGTGSHDYTPMFQGPVFFCGWILVIGLFYCGFWCKSGQTVGMRAWRLQVESTLGANQLPSIDQAVRRCFFGLLSLLTAGAGYWYSWLNPQRDCWHDVMSKTRVIVKI